eukprot:3601771-Ditylum_brightwellii.AAC.1
MEKSKEYKHVVCNKGNDVDDNVNYIVDNSVDNGDDGNDDCDDGADKHLSDLSQAAVCCLTERSKQNKDVVCNKDSDVDDDSYDSVDN